MATAKVALIEPDPFLKTSSKVTDYIPNFRVDSKAARDRKINDTKDMFSMDEITKVSRPLNGIAAKPNTHAYVQVVDANQKVLKVFNQLGLPGHVAMSGGSTKGLTGKDIFDNSPEKPALAGRMNVQKRGSYDSTQKGGAKLGSSGAGMDEEGNPAANAWTDWILQNVREARVEKTQLVETFGDSYLYAFGEKPRVLGFSGLLMNTDDYNWRGIFWENWDRFFRATKLIERNARMYIGWEDILVEGYPIQAVAQETADSPNALSFSFQFYVTNYFNMSMANKMGKANMKRKHTLAMSESLYSSASIGTNTAQMKDTRWSIFDIALGKGAASKAFLFNPATYNPATGKWEAREGGDWRPLSMNYNEAGPWERMGMTLAKQAADMLVKAPYKLTAGGQTNIATWVNNTVGQMQYQALMTTKNILTDEAEKAMGAKPGEINGWFGYLGMIIDNMDRRDIGNGDVAKNRWDGRTSGGATVDILKSGSLDRMIQRMSYHLQGSMIEAGRYSDAYAKNNGKAGEPGEPFGAYPGAAVALYTAATNPASYTAFDVSKFTLADSEFNG